MDFKKLAELNKSLRHNLDVTIKFQLTGAGLAAEELETRFSYLMNSSQSKELSDFVVFLLRIAKANYWEGEIKVSETTEHPNEG